MMAAGWLPDVDGVTLLAGGEAYQTYRRVVGHGLLMSLIGPALLAPFGTWLPEPCSLLPPWLGLLLVYVDHLVADDCFYRWPVLLLWPFSSRGWGLGWIRWNDPVPTLGLYGAVAVAITWPLVGPVAALAGIGTLLFYMVWRACRPPSQSPLASGLTAIGRDRSHRSGVG